MLEDRVYLDHNATTPVRPQAARAVGRALVRGGNPSSIHAEGRAARASMENAREAIAALVGATPKNVIFTSGATEALNLALTPSLQAGSDARRWRLFAGATEHPAVLSGHRFSRADVSIVPVTADGLLDRAALAADLDAHAESRPMLALQFANNETGVIQEVAEAAAMIHARNGIVVCDAVQAAGRLPIDMAALGADLIALSAHKIGGPLGVGALVRATDAIHFPGALVRGGGQEKGLRAGTENVPGIAGFAAAAETVLADQDVEAARLAALRERLEAGLRRLDPGVAIFGSGTARLPNTVAFAFGGIAAEMALIALDLEGFAVSSGSACSSGKVKSSHVLDAMGVDTNMRRCMLRASLGWCSWELDVDRFLDALARLHAKFSSAGKILAA